MISYENKLRIYTEKINLLINTENLSSQEISHLKSIITFFKPEFYSGNYADLVDSFKSLIGKDTLSIDARKIFENVFRLSCEISSHVQYVGMSKPVPIDKIYQKTKLSDSPYSEYGNIDIYDIIINKF
ncbi:MAG: hypothetical protein ABSF34_21385, partial [Verrucomicrobiota bacterium]